MTELNLSLGQKKVIRNVELDPNLQNVIYQNGYYQYFALYGLKSIFLLSFYTKFQGRQVQNLRMPIKSLIIDQLQ